MTMTLQAIQVGTPTVVLDWSTTDPDPALGFEAAINIDAGGWIGLATLSGTLRRFYDVSNLWSPGSILEYRIKDMDTAAEATATVTAADLDLPFTYGPPRADADAPRYTSLETVRRRLRIPDTETGFDEDLTEAIVASEIALDFELGRSFPDTGTNPQYAFVPRNISMLCTSAAIAVYKAADAPFGTAGSEDWFGAQSIADVASQTIRRSPLIRGFQVSFGTG